MANYLGMLGPGDFPANFEPEDWQQAVLYENPNGIAPLFAMLSMFPKEEVRDQQYHWFTMSLVDRALTTTAGANIYLDQDFTTAYVYATHQATKGIAGANLYLKCTEDFAKKAAVPGTLILLRDASDLSVDVACVSKQINLNGANSWILVTLEEADDNAATPAAGASLQSVDTFYIYSKKFPPGSNTPPAVVEHETEFENYTQIVRNALDLTRTVKSSINRLGDNYKRELQKVTIRNSRDWEELLFWGRKTTGTNAINGKRETTTWGMYEFLKANNSSNIRDFSNWVDTTDEKYAGKTWLQKGEDFIDQSITLLKRYLGETPFFMCGDLAMNGIGRLAKTYGQVNIAPESKSYGIEVTKWNTPNGSADFMTHPLLSLNATTRNTVFGFHPRNVKLCPLVGGGENGNIELMEDVQTPGYDGKTDCFIGEMGTKFYFPNQFLVLHGVGLDHVSAA